MKPPLLKRCVRSWRSRKTTGLGKRSAAAWLRLALRWRRRLPLATAPRKTAPLQHAWNSHFSQVHLHRHVTVPGVPASMPAAAYRIAAWAQQRAETAAPLAPRPTVSGHGSVPAAPSRPLRGQLPEPARARRDASVADAVPARRSVPSIVPLTLRLQPLRAVRERVVTRSLQVRTQLTSTYRHAERRTTEQRYLRGRAAPGERAAVPVIGRYTRYQDRAAKPAPHARAEGHALLPPAAMALVWRKARVEPDAPDASGTRAPGAQPAREAASTVQPAQTSAREARVPATAPEPLRAAALDPALADRLAEDVVRRVEKRLRIERERRGL